MQASDDADHDGDWEVIETQEAAGAANGPLGPSSQPTCRWRMTWKVRVDGQDQKWSVYSKGWYNTGAQPYGSAEPATISLPLRRQIQDGEDSHAVHKQSSSPLFRLPAELRYHIYEDLFTLDPSIASLKWCPSRQRSRFSPSVLCFLETCRLALLEAEPIFYSINRLVYPTTVSPSARPFAHAIGPRRLDAVEKLTIMVKTSGELYHWIEQLALFPRLRELRIERFSSARYADPRSWKIMVPQISEVLKKMGELRKLDIVTPEVNAPTPDEEGRIREMKEIDDIWYGVVASHYRTTPSS